MKINLYAVLAAIGIFFGSLGCGLTDTLISNTVGGAKGNTISNLWSDVPPIQGAQKLTLDLPITVQLAIQGLIKASASSSEGGNIDQFDWIAYSTNQSPQQVAAFYSNERMTAAGWNLKDEPGCAAGGDATAGGGGFCIFGKGQGTANQKGSVLFIVLAQDDKTKQTQVYYVRLEGIIEKRHADKGQVMA